VKRFTELFDAIDSSTSTRAKTAALADYFTAADARDAAWAAWFLTGHRPRMAVPTRRLHTWAAEVAGIPLWLFEECYDAVGDLAETIALVLPPPKTACDDPLHAWIEERLLPLRELPEAEQRARLVEHWDCLDGTERFVFNKLITGNFRVGVSSLLVVRAIAQAFGLDAKVVAHRLTGSGRPRPRHGRRSSTRKRGKLISQSPIRSSLLTRWKARPKASAIAATGWPNGSGTASARS
jgi:DNA ligase 1